MHSKYYPAILTLVALAFALTMFAQSGVPVNDSVNVVFSNFINTSDEKSIVLLTNRNIYAAGEKPISGVTIENLVSTMKHSNVTLHKDLESLPQIVLSMAHPGDMILFLGAGTITAVADKTARLLTDEVKQ